MLRSTLAVALVVSSPAAELLQNPDFETPPFPSGWSSSGGTVAVAGLNGTATAARLPFNTSASLSQALASPAVDFTFDVSFQTPGVNEAQSFRMTLAAGGSDVIDLRAATNGVLQLGTGNGGYLPLTAIAGGATADIPINQTVKLRIIGRGFGSPAARYDLLWTAPYTGATAPAFTRAALQLSAFTSAAATHSPVDALRFSRNITAANSFIVDGLSMQDAAPAAGVAATHELVTPAPDRVVNISGIYPHLAMTNSHLECGTGAVVPWAGKLWVITYGPHLPNGSTDKLYEISPDLTRVIRPESVGGTPANRFVHAASNQLNIGPHFIDTAGTVRTLRPAGQSTGVIPGRLTGSAAHISDPSRMYLFTMEDGLYDVDPADLSYIVRYPDVQGTGDKFLHGYHGKGCYTGQGLFVATNNGRNWNTGVPTGPGGVLATWDGTTVAENGGYLAGPGGFFYSNNPDSGNPVAAQAQYMAGWDQISLTQHCEATGPGGIYGNSSSSDPVWSTGFDAKSVLLHVMENQEWNLWRLPKGSYSHDGSHGWHTEWPRIRPLDPGDPGTTYLMHMHGLFFDFPKTFSGADFSGLRPICSYYKMPTDYCRFFDGRIVMGKNDASQFDNALALKNQSNLWFGTLEDMENWGAPSGHGAVWMNDAVAAEQHSDPFFIGGFPQRTLHLRNGGASAVTVELESSAGSPAWSFIRSITVPAGGYVAEILSDLPDPWVRLRAASSGTNLTAFFHLGSPYPHATPASAGGDEFAALADIRDTRSMSDGVIRVMNDPTLPLEFASTRTTAEGSNAAHRYHRIGGDIVLQDRDNPTAEAALRSAGATSKEFGSDAASAWILNGGVRFRLPKLDPHYDAPFAAGWARGIRETVTERQLLNCHGTFYEVPRSNSGGFRKMRALATHGKRITDFASWRGLLVMTGVLDDAPASDRLVRTADGTAALWLGEIDDLWRMGEPRGRGGPWENTAVGADTASDLYLMYGFDRKELTLTASDATTVTVEVDFLADNTWSVYQTFPLAAGQTITHLFPAGFHAHWVRVKSSAATTATARFTYGPADRRDAFLDWARDQGMATGSGRAALAEVDHDGDGLTALAEFVLGTDPHTAGPGAMHITDGQVSFILRDLAAHDGISCTLESSESLAGAWLPRPDLQLAATDQSGVSAGFTRMRCVLEPGHPSFFVRLRATLAP
jgi:hypothetical protein